MSAFQFNSSDIASMTSTFSWGLSPASGEVTLPGSVSVAAGTAFVINLGGLTFHGVVSKSTVVRNDGDSTVLELVDNRIKLMWDDVYCAFNNQDVVEDDPLTPGIDRKKRFWHIKPEDWDAQMKSWTSSPYSASDVIQMLIGADTVSVGWSLDTHATQEAAVLGIDANHGAKLGNVLQDISERQGLVFTLDGESTLRWARKGEGTPAVVPAGAYDIRDGDALSHNDTQVRLVGDRNMYQDMPIALEPDWNSRYEAYWSETAWFAEVDARFGAFDSTTAGQASLSAKAHAVTLREYVTARGDNAYADWGLWGEAGRMEIPAWLYIRDIVYKAYRVPRGYTINGISLDSLNLREGMLAACTFSDSGVFSLKSPREFYPDAKAGVLVQGQQLSLLDARTQNVITATQLSNARTKWSASNKFNLDTKNKGIVFHDAVFIPGAGAAGLFVFPNQAVDDIDETHELYHLSVPNADVTIAPAAVRAVMTFEAELYSKRYGSGNRKGSRVVKDLCYHALMLSGAFSEEVKYADGDGAEDKADAEAAALILQESVYRSGGYRRPGAAGTGLSSVLDRVTVTLTFDEGLVEAVEHTKERNQSNVEHEREMDRRSRQKDLFPSQRANATDVGNLQLIARISKELPRRGATAYRSASEVMQRVVGSSHTSPRLIKLDDTAAAGTVIWQDDSGAVADNGTRFSGVVIADNSTGFQVALATQGTALIKVSGPFASGDAVGSNDASPSKVVKDGARSLGIVNASYTGASDVLAPVRLAGAGGGAEAWPFQGYASPFTGSGSPPGDQARRFKLKLGKVNGFTPSNMTEEFTCPAGGTIVVWAKAEISPTTRRVSAASLDSGDATPATPAADPDSGAPPAWTARGLVEVTADADKITDIKPLVTDSQWVKVDVVNVDAASGIATFDLSWASAGSRSALYLP